MKLANEHACTSELQGTAHAAKETQRQTPLARLATRLAARAAFDVTSLSPHGLYLTIPIYKHAHSPISLINNSLIIASIQKRQRTPRLAPTRSTHTRRAGRDLGNTLYIKDCSKVRNSGEICEKLSYQIAYCFLFRALTFPSADVWNAANLELCSSVICTYGGISERIPRAIDDARQKIMLYVLANTIMQATRTVNCLTTVYEWSKTLY